MCIISAQTNQIILLDAVTQKAYPTKPNANDIHVFGLLLVTSIHLSYLSDYSGIMYVLYVSIQDEYFEHLGRFKVTE